LQKWKSEGKVLANVHSRPENLAARVTAQHTATSPFTSQAAVQVVLKLTAVDAGAAKAAVATVLFNQQQHCLAIDACSRYEVFTDGDDSPVTLVLQAWSSQSALDAYYDSGAFAAATPLLTGLLTVPPESETYTTVKS
jgi:quinol monooxygenase YgiN